MKDEELRAIKLAIRLLYEAGDDVYRSRVREALLFEEDQIAAKAALDVLNGVSE